VATEINVPDPGLSTDIEVAAAVVALTSSLNTESVTRAGAISSLTSGLSNEASARSSSVATLQTSVTSAAAVAAAAIPSANADKPNGPPLLRSDGTLPFKRSRQRASYFRHMIPVSTRPAHGLTTKSNGTDTGGNSRVKQVAPCDISSLALSFRNYYNGDSITSLGTLTVSAAIELSGGFYPIFFSGSSTVSIAPGTGGVVSSTIGLAIPAGTTYYIRTYVQVSAGASSCWPHMLTTRSADGEGSTRGSSETTKTTSGTITAASEGVYTAEAVLANAVGLNGQPYDLPVIGCVGDSLVYGIGETSPETDLGFLTRALNNQFANIKFDRSGSTVKDFVLPAGTSGSVYRLPMIDGCTTIIDEFGVNDLNSARTLAQLQADCLTLWTYAAHRNIRVFRTTLSPWTTSTDLWATTTNQTVTAWESDRVAFNAWVRDGAPIDSTTKAAVATGTSSGVLRAGASGHPLFGYFETADALESARNSGKWAVNGTDNYPTADGIHPSPTFHQLMAGAIDTSRFI
jgi:hypothetical protein